jgi:hypothetical protein
LKREQGVRHQLPPEYAATWYSSHIALEATIHLHGWTGYNGLVDVGYAKHLRVKHRAHDFATSQTHINDIESFLSFAKRLKKYNGVRRHSLLTPFAWMRDECSIFCASMRANLC